MNSHGTTCKQKRIRCLVNCNYSAIYVSQIWFPCVVQGILADTDSKLSDVVKHSCSLQQSFSPNMCTTTEAERPMCNTEVAERFLPPQTGYNISPRCIFSNLIGVCNSYSQSTCRQSYFRANWKSQKQVVFLPQWLSWKTAPRSVKNSRRDLHEIKIDIYKYHSKRVHTAKKNFSLRQDSKSIFHWSWQIWLFPENVLKLLDSAFWCD